MLQIDAVKLFWCGNYDQTAWYWTVTTVLNSV